MKEVLKKFGKYFLLDLIAQGGMAEIYRARLASADGAGRLIVIKRIQAGYGSNSEFLEMFRSEIKVTMGFNHPNIVQLYDFGEEQKQPYIVMEFVDGKNLRQYISRGTELKKPIPVDLAAYIVEQAAGGLHYAHTFKDKITGQPLNIVHRDISPQNLIVSYEGNVKVIDFGIAKATTNSEATRAGVIKGKPSYLSPEQISGEPLDGRCDIFALGIVLWETLTGKKLFAGENDLAVLKLIEASATHVKPPSTLNPSVPKELDYIVLRALAKQREKRYQTAEEMQRALHKFLYSFNSDFNPSDLSYFAKELFKEDIVQDRKSIQKLNDKAIQLLSEDIPDVPTLGGMTDPGMTKEDTTTIVKAGKMSRGSDLILSPNDKKVEIELPKDHRAISPALSPGPSRSVNATQSKPYIPQQKLGQQSQASNSGSKGKLLLLIAAGVGAVVVLGPQLGLLPSTPSVPVVPASKSNTTADGTSPVAASKSVLLRLDVTPGWGGVAITLNGRPVDMVNPVVQVPLDSPLELVAEREGFKTLKREFVLESRQMAGLKEWLEKVQLEPLNFGYLTIHSTPSADASIRPIDSTGRVIAGEGKPWVLRTPIENEKFPTGTYEIRLENVVLGMEKTVSVTIEEGKAIKLDERLAIKN